MSKNTSVKGTSDIANVVYGTLAADLGKLESVPLLQTTLTEAFKLGQLVNFIRDFVPEAFFMFVNCFVNKKPLRPVPEAPIAHWESLDKKEKARREFIVAGDTSTGWEYVSIDLLSRQRFGTSPEKLAKYLEQRYHSLRKAIKKARKGRLPTHPLCCVVLAPDWEKAETIPLKITKAGKLDSVPAKKFIAELRTRAKTLGIEVLTFKSLYHKYETMILDSDFRKTWSEYQRTLYLDLMKHFPMMAYSLCHDDYLEYKDYKNRAEVDLYDKKSPESIAMNCKALEHVFRIYFFMKNMEEAPERELGWLYQSLKGHVKKELGDTFCTDLEFILSNRPYAVHAKKLKKKFDQLEAEEVNDRTSIFCKMFFLKKWNIRL